MMFNGDAAWFSESVNPDHIKSWVDNGGKKVKNPIDADFCFSSSCCEKTTKSLLEPMPGKRKIGFLPTVLHPEYIKQCLNESEKPSAMDFAIPSEQLLPLVAQQRGDKDKWLVDLLQSHKRCLEDHSEKESSQLKIEKHLGLKRKTVREEELIVPEIPKKCFGSIFGVPQESSVSLKDIPISKCQLRLLRLHLP